ncbi:MAG: AAA-like domain-containing protein, partial [Candidatus Fibromonas sp.]|nr:AAA-like domain-containing protein [Candidatus Fibromonas sp.]
MREFNVTGLCIPGKHYMVDISEKVRQIFAMVEKGQYFTINRARQYGKTTTIRQLEKALLEAGYLVARISFEGVGDTPFENEKNFCLNLLRQISEAFDMRDIKGYKLWRDKTITSFSKMDAFLNKMCSGKKVVLIIDETDKTSNNLVFLRFIGMLRDKYLERENPKKATFQSVILAGVYDIKNLKLKMVKAGTHQLKDGEKRINSPWNIAADFEIDMSFSASEIATMLDEYEKDHETGMDIKAISEEIRAYTSGYPYMVSRLCKIIDEKQEKDWTLNGVRNAVNLLLIDKNTLFDDLGKNLNSNEDLYNLIYDIIMCGKRIEYNTLDSAADIGITFGFLKREDNSIVMGNRIFEILIANYFVIMARRAEISQDIPETFTENGKFNMALCVKKFAQHYYELYNKKDRKFLERECRFLFLTYLKPLINGNGFYHI